MVLMGFNNVKEILFYNVFIYLKILDGYGEMMLKLKGNGIDLFDIIDKFGVDVLWFLMVYLIIEM